MPIDRSHMDVFYRRHPYYKRLISQIRAEDFNDGSIVRWLLDGFNEWKPGPREIAYLRKVIVAVCKRSGGFPVRFPTFKRLTENALKRLIADMRLSDKMDHKDIAIALNIHPSTAKKIVLSVDRAKAEQVKNPES